MLITALIYISNKDVLIAQNICLSIGFIIVLFFFCKYFKEVVQCILKPKSNTVYCEDSDYFESDEFKEANEKARCESLEKEYSKTITKTPAKTLPKGWVWVDYNDGSGHLESPDGFRYFSYDMETAEYWDIDGNIQFMFGPEWRNPYPMAMPYEEYKQFAENAIIKGGYIDG